MSTCAVCGAVVPDGARFCPACGAELDAMPQATEERKLATVLFADLVGSTARADEEDPERVRVLQERFFDAMAEEIERTGGTVEKFAGDAVMAVFGAPASLEDHAERALHAALAMQSRFAEHFGVELGLRIGVNTGEVVAGQPREGSSFVTGDAVNVGARLEQAAAPGEVLAGERTVAAARGAFEFGDPRLIVAKGKPEGVAGRAVVRSLTLARPRGVAGFPRVFVGRESELELLRATFRRVVGQEEPHLVTIVGEPGIGKTRLVRELWELLAEEDVPPLRRTGRCLPYGDGVTYWPVAEIVREHFGIREGETPEAVMRKLGGREILGLALGLDVGGGLHPLDARERLHGAVVEFVEELQAERPAVFLIEDIHWAEDDLLDLLDRVVRDAHVAVLVLATTRPELLDRRPSWGGGRRNATTIWLEPLASTSTSQMLDELLIADLPDELRSLVVERAEGNPFFVEELVGSLVEAGVLERGADGWRARRLPEGFSVPDSIHAVLAARVDRLPPREKAALQAASVIGRVFWPGPVVHLLDGDEPDLALLEERDFVRRQGGSSLAGEREYAIKHALTREVAYAGIPKARRGRLHASLAQWLERRAKDEHAPLLAYHYAQAVRPEDADLVWAEEPDELARLRARAVRWLRQASQLARGRYEILDAVALLERAVDLSDDEHERARLWLEIGSAQVLRFDGGAFWEALQRALEGPLSREERAEVYGLLAFQTSIRSGMWAVRPDPDVVAGWAEAAIGLAEEHSRARVHALLAIANVDPVRHTDEVDEAVRLADALGDVDLRSYALATRGYRAFDEGRLGDADAIVRQRLELVPLIGDLDHVAEVYESSVPTITTLARLGEARLLAEEHERLSTGLSPHHRVHSAGLRCEIEEAVGDWDAIVERTGQIVDAVERNLATPCVRNPRSLLVCALAHAAMGDEARARDLERRAIALQGVGHDWVLAPPRLRLALLRGDRERVAGLLESPWVRSRVFGPAVVAARLDGHLALGDHDHAAQEAAPFASGGGLLEPFALRALGIARRDDELLGRADALFAEMGLEWHRAQTERLTGGL